MWRILPCLLVPVLQAPRHVPQLVALSHRQDRHQDLPQLVAHAGHPLSGTCARSGQLPGHLQRTGVFHPSVKVQLFTGEM